MSHLKRLASFLLCLCLTAGMIFTASAETPFAMVYLRANSMSFPTRLLHVEVYRRGESGGFTAADAVRYSCQVNQLSGDAELDILATHSGVQITVDYLTDMNRDGIYELLDGEETSTSDCVTTSGRIAAARTSTAKSLKSNEQYTLTAADLRTRGAAVIKARSGGGEYGLADVAADAAPDPLTTLYLVTLRCTDDAGAVQERCYYFQIYGKVILPSDVPVYSWFRPGAEYALERGFLSGTGADTFSPSGSVTRSQLAQILWRLGGSKTAGDCGYSDVPATAWFAQAVNWCCETGLMDGSEGQFLPNRALTREELAVTLQAFAQNAGKRLTGRRSLDEFTDGAAVSVWARDGVEWAAAAGFLSGYDDGTLRPINGITRAELAVVMRKYCLDLKL